MKSMGIKLINALVSQLKGSKEITSDGGTTVTIIFPEAVNDEPAHSDC